MFKVNTFYRLRNGYVGLRPYSSANFLMKEFTEPFEVLEVNNDGWVLAIRTSKGETYTSCLSEKQGIKIAYDVILFDTEIKNYIEWPKTPEQKTETKHIVVVDGQVCYTTSKDKAACEARVFKAENPNSLVEIYELVGTAKASIIIE